MKFTELNWDGLPRGAQFMLELTGIDLLAMRAYEEKNAGFFHAHGYVKVKIRDVHKHVDKHVMDVYFDAERVPIEKP